MNGLRQLPLTFLLLVSPFMSEQSTESHAAASVVEDEIVRSGTIFHVRLRQTISSFGSKQDTPISAIVIQPVQVDGVIFVPMNTELRGTITGVGVGLSHETAQLNLHFDTLILPGRSPQALAGRDDERSKAIDDLWVTGCVDGVSYIERLWVPRNAKNATGDTLTTDGRLAIAHERLR